MKVYIKPEIEVVNMLLGERIATDWIEGELNEDAVTSEWAFDDEINEILEGDIFETNTIFTPYSPDSTD